MKRCSNCGETLSVIMPAGDDRPRFFCPACNIIHYQNPKMVVGCIPEYEGKILLCKRGIEPCMGTWTLPAGYLENGETVNACAQREASEESGARLVDLVPYRLFNICHIHQLYLMFRCRLADSRIAAGRESAEVRLFSELDIPWNELSFPVITETLRHFFQDRNHGRYVFCIFDIPPSKPKDLYCGATGLDI